MANGHEGPIWDPSNVPGHGYARAERVCSDVFWGKSRSGYSHLLGLVPDDGDVIGSAN